MKPPPAPGRAPPGPAPPGADGLLAPKRPGEPVPGLAGRASEPEPGPPKRRCPVPPPEKPVVLRSLWVLDPSGSRAAPGLPGADPGGGRLTPGGGGIGFPERDRGGPDATGAPAGDGDGVGALAAFAAGVATGAGDAGAAGTL